MDLAETIKFIRDAGIKVWVLTGDKVETAINIGFSSALIDSTMQQYHLTQSDHQTLLEYSDDYLQSVKETAGVQKSALIVSGESLLKIFGNQGLK